MALPDSANFEGYWELDETSGTRYDSTTNNNDLTDTNTVLYGSGVISNAADFESTNSERLTIADNASLSIASDITIGCWWNAESQAAWRILMCKGNSHSAASNFEYMITATAVPSHLAIYVSNGSNYQFAAYTSGISTATWYFVVGWYDSADGKCYIQVNNGTPLVGAASSYGPHDGAFSFVLGDGAAGSFPSDGLMDLAFVYRGVMTSDERTAMYNGGAGVSWADISGGGISVPIFDHHYRMRRG